VRGGNSSIRRVAVTGLGAVTPLGSTVEAFWENLCAGRSGVGPITLFDASGLRTRIAAEVRDWAPPAAIGGRGTRRMDRFALFGLSAAMEAWQDSCLFGRGNPGYPAAGLGDPAAGLGVLPVDPYEVGVVVGSSHGGEGTLLAEVGHVLHGDARKISARLIPRMLSNMAAAQIAIRLGLHGPNFSLGSACATGGHAIGEAAEIIRRGDAKVMLCGGADAAITPLTLAGDQAVSALSVRNEAPEQASRPFDAARDGFVLGEGAAVLVLEEWEHALERKAHIYAELSGYAATADAVHETRPDPSGVPASRGITRALEKAGISAGELDGIFAHATGTPLGDPAEAEALRLALGESLSGIPVTAIKSALGHLLAAAGAVQAVAVVKALQTQQLPPTLNLESPDPACALTFVTGATQPATLRHVLSNSFGFGGHNASLIFSAPSR
jgi:3-oxoacyl-[acyl-carrier-protein] synthase II